MDLFYTLLNHSIGRDLEDLKWNYSIAQIYLLYDKCKTKEFDDYRMSAILQAQASVFTSPYGEKKDMNKRRKTWEDFLNSLDYTQTKSKRTKKTAKNVRQIKSIFSAPNIPVPIKK